jgi:hypothetical protein
MKFINLCHYVSDLDKVAKLRPAHRNYMDELEQQGRLWAAGPFADGQGALFIYEAETLQEATAVCISRARSLRMSAQSKTSG